MLSSTCGDLQTCVHGIGLFVRESSGTLVEVPDEFISSTLLDLEGTTVPRQTCGTVKSPRLIGWNQWLDCYLNGNVELPIATYVWIWDGYRDDVKLKCGNDSYGYRHIDWKHSTDWKNKYNAAVAKGWIPQQQNVHSWDDLRSLAAAVTLSWPENYVEQAGNKICVTSEVWMYRVSDMRVVDSFWVRAVFGKYTRNLITVFPQSDDYCPST